MVPAPAGAQAFGRTVQADLQRWADVIRRAGVTAD
jgi:hypothetical protein